MQTKESLLTAESYLSDVPVLFPLSDHPTLKSKKANTEMNKYKSHQQSQVWWTAATLTVNLSCLLSERNSNFAR